MPNDTPPRQLTFDLPFDPRYGREDFLVGDANEAAYGLIEAWPQWPDRVLLLFGPAGSGKSHLAAIWAERAHAWTVPAAGVTHERVQHLVSNGALVIEDIDRPEGRDEAALFHLLNLVRERGSPVLFTSGRPIDALALSTPDLRSRLRLAPSVAIDAPDDALLRAVLVKLFVDRQLIVDLGVIEAVALRIDRSLGRARDVVAELDRDALGRGRRISRPLALAVLRRMGLDGDTEAEDEAG